MMISNNQIKCQCESLLEVIRCVFDSSVNYSESEDMMLQAFSLIRRFNGRGGPEAFSPRYEIIFLSVSNSFTSNKSSGFGSFSLKESQMKTAMFSPVEVTLLKYGTSLSIFL